MIQGLSFRAGDRVVFKNELGCKDLDIGTNFTKNT